MNVYTVRDSKVEAYLPPFYAINHAVAVRMLQDSALDPNSMFHKHPEDFQVFCIGEFIEKDGEIVPLLHESLGKVIDLLVKNDEK